MKNIKPKRQSGFSLIELLVGLGITAAILTGVLANRESASLKSEVNLEVSALQGFASCMEALSFGNRGNFTDLGLDDAQNASCIPTTFQANLTSTPPTLGTPLGRTLTYAVATAPNDRVFTLTYDAGLSEAQCITLASQILSSFSQVAIGASGSEVAVTSVADATGTNACGATSPVVVITAP